MAGTAARAARRDRISRTGGSGMGITRYVLKHPVTTIMGLLCLIVFGISSVFSATKPLIIQLLVNQINAYQC